MAVDPSLVIRTQERGDAPYLLHIVGDVLRLSDGRLVVENRGPRELLIFDANVAFMEAWGGPGDGPGEFSASMMRTFECANGTLSAVDFRRATVFDSAGVVVRTYTLPGIAGLYPHPRHFIGMSDDCGSLVLHAETLGWIPDQFTGPERVIPLGQGQGHGFVFSYIVQVTLGEGIADTVGFFPDKEVTKAHERDGGYRAYRLVASHATDGYRLFYGLGDAPEFTVFDGHGAPVRITRWAAPGQPVTAEEWAVYAAEREQYLRGRPEAAASLHAVGEYVTPTVKPFFSAEHLMTNHQSALLIDDEDNTWVRRYSRPSLLETSAVPAGHWLVFDASGRWLGEVETPERFLIRTIRDGHLYGVWRDEFDVEEVRAYPIVKARL